MKALVIFETLWGNTEQVARAIGDGMKDGADVTVIDVQELSTALIDGVDLLVVGGPTHMWGMSKPSSRKVRTGPTYGQQSASRNMGVREWLDTLPPARRYAFAAFDTRLNKTRWLTGSAARSIRKALRRRGHVEVAPPQSFRVAHSDGPLVEGELDRATAWGQELLTRSRKAA